MTGVKLFQDLIVHTTDHFTIAQDCEVPLPGFFIVAAKRKLRSLAEFTDAETQEFVQLIRAVRNGMQDMLQINTVYFFQNEDTEHNFHFWIFPRHVWMESFGRKIESVKPIMNYAKEHCATPSIIAEVHRVAEQMKTYLQRELKNSEK